ncbi:MAG: histidine phosphatase family protein [Candidatus Eremiobacteraeota bacterium]|nr:histidine phosphatase family protein [Candidatus Eremiobacteraeota bacterium]
MEIGWPRELFLIRHAESAGNVARALAMANDALVIDIDSRDCDVPLSPLGERQAAALGAWCARHIDPVDAVLSSPYVRAQQTSKIALREAGWHDIPIVADERLREKEFGMLDRLTRGGIEHRFPEQAEMRRVLGKFYYRPPGGESWTDVILRLRSVIDTLTREYNNCRVAVVSHQVIVLCFRYLFEGLTEEQILAIDAAGDVANCSVTTYRYNEAGKKLELRSYNVAAPMEEAGEPVTREPDAPVARK